MPDNGLPKGWSRTRLGEHLSAILGGGTPSRKVPAFWQGDIPWASVKDMKSRVLTATEESVSQAGIDSGATRVVPPGSVVLATRMAVGAVAITDKPIAINQDLKALVPADGLYSQFLLHLMEYNGERLARQGTGTTVAGIRIDDVEMLPFLLPPPDEQRRIAEVLDAIDAAIEKTEAVIAATERLRSALLAELLTRGVPGWHTEWKQVPGIGTIPSCWDVVRLGDAAGVQTGRQVGKAPGNGAPVVLPYLSVANVKDGYLHLETVKTMAVGASEIARFSLRPGDVLFTEGGDADKLGRGCVWNGEIEPCLHQNHVFAVRPHSNRLSPDLLAAYARSPRGKSYFLGCSKQTTNLASINSTQLKAMPLPLPTLDEQRAMLDVLKAVAGRAESENAALEALTAAKRTAAASLLSGRVRFGVERNG
jgi:type I restriction enzyme S subunit